MTHSTLLRWSSTALVVVLLFSCKNELEKVMAFASEDEWPFQTTYNATYTYTEKGQVLNRVMAGEVNRFGADTGRTEFSSGFLLIFYDSLQQEESRLQSLRALQYHHRNLMIAEDSVFFTNEQGETLETSLLIMDRDSGLIYTDEPVKITRDETIIFGDGLRANETFSWYRIINPRGEFYMDDEEDDLP
ncbi:MAG: LPS export ABC transporter periplasmic protein LptC [Cryomorphaceae bacterium]|nr:MAG: LPS export ABC transporter periplasmic protein LptC [Cryomorphaceae bacterium]